MEGQVLFAGPDGQHRLLREMGRSGASKDYEVQFRRKDIRAWRGEHKIANGDG